MKGIKKMLVVKKSSIITLCLISILVVAGYLNYVNKKIELPSSLAVTSENEESYFEEKEPENYGEVKFVGATPKNETDIRFERDKKKSEVIAMYKEVSENTALGEKEKNEAAMAMLKLAKESDMEINIETLIAAKGFSNPTAVISNDGVTVFVEKDSLTKTDIAVIRDVVIAETNVTSDRIRINLNETGN